jgi:hypothetical protein
MELANGRRAIVSHSATGKSISRPFVSIQNGHENLRSEWELSIYEWEISVQNGNCPCVIVKSPFGMGLFYA